MEEHFIFFFLDSWHHGALNFVVHSIGFTILGYGLGRRNWWLVIFSPFIMESGHLWNYFQGLHTEHFIKIIPLQLLAWAVFVGAGYLIARHFNKNKDN